MRGPHEAKRDFSREFHRLAHADRLELLQRFLRFFERIERQRRIVLRFLHLVIEARVFFLQMSGVGQDNAAQINRRLRGIDRPAESIFDQARNPSAVVEVRVGQDDRIDPVRRDRKILPVALAPFLRPLEEPAVDERLKSAVARGISSIDEMLRASNRPRRAKKLYVRQTCLPHKHINLPRRLGDTENSNLVIPSEARNLLFAAAHLLIPSNARTRCPANTT